MGKVLLCHTPNFNKKYFLKIKVFKKCLREQCFCVSVRDNKELCEKYVSIIKNFMQESLKRF